MGLFIKQWDPQTCSKIFDQVARRIFRERRNSILSRILQPVFGDGTIFGNVHKWLLWLLHDGCYDGRNFDSALKEVFEEKIYLFDAIGSSTTQCSRTRVGVTATNIAKETRSFVFGNFNAVELSGDNSGQYCDYARRADEI